MTFFSSNIGGKGNIQCIVIDQLLYIDGCVKFWQSDVFSSKIGGKSDIPCIAIDQCIAFDQYIAIGVKFWHFFLQKIAAKVKSMQCIAIDESIATDKGVTFFSSKIGGKGDINA